MVSNMLVLQFILGSPFFAFFVLDYMSWSKSIVFLKASVVFFIVDSASFLLKFSFFTQKNDGLFDSKRHNFFQN